MAMCPFVVYKPCATSLREQTGYLIVFAQFEAGNLLSETRNDAESGENSDDDYIMPPLLSKEEMDAMDYDNESDGDPMTTEMLGDIHDGSQSHLNVNRR